MPQRDNFTKTTKNLLASRVGYRCSNPTCRLQTSGPSVNETEAVNLGVAAHIVAASVGGPRYDTAMTSEQRASASNGIWLCQTCAKLIDSDVAKFTVEVLREWRSIAEHFAESENQGFFSSREDGPSIQVAVDDWRPSISEGSYDGPGVFMPSFHKAGDMTYSCKVRFQNHSQHSHLLTNPSVELLSRETILESVYANITSLPDIELPVGKWVTVDIHNGFKGSENYRRADSVWFRGDLAGQENGLNVKLASLSDSES